MEPAATVEGGAGLVGLSAAWGAPLAGAAVLAGVAALALGGLLTVLRQRQTGGWLMAAVMLSGVLFACLCYAGGLYYYPRFAIAQVPLLALGIGLLWTAGSRAKLLTAAGLSVWLATVWPALTVLLERPIEPLRPVAQWLETQGTEALALAYGHGREALMVLKPGVVAVDDEAQLRTAVAEARAAGRAAFLVVGHFQFNRALLPSGFRMIDDPLQFEEVARFDGVESEFHYRIFKAR